MTSKIRICLLTTMMFLAYVLVYCQTSSLSMAIVCMVNHTTEAGDQQVYDNMSFNTLNASKICPNHEAKLTNNESLNGVFNWPKSLQGHILSAYFITYAVFHIPAGILANRYGGNLVITLGMLIGTLATFVTPMAANAGWQYLITIRLIQGIGLAGPMPAISTILVECLPASYSTLICGITLAGIPIGLAVGLFTSGYLCKHGFAGGWPSIFYTIGAASFLWLLVWMAIPKGDASQCYSLHLCLADKNKYEIKSDNKEKEKKKIPWRQLLTSKAVLAYIVGFVIADWGFYILSTSVPTYIHEVLHFDIVENGMFIGISYVGMCIFTIVTIVLSKKLIHWNVMSIVLIRKLFTSISFTVPALSLVGLSYMTCSQPTLAKVLLITTIAFTGINLGSTCVNHLDIAPTYAGIIIGIANAIGTVNGIVAPQITAALTPNKTREEWQVLFFICAGIYGFGVLVFTVFGSGKVQEWDKQAKQTVKSI